MINLLPPQEKELIKLEIKKRLFLILWFLILFFLVCFILILSSIKFYLSGEIESRRILIEKVRDKEKQAQFEELERKLDAFNKVLEKTDSFYSKRIYLSNALFRIAELLPENSYLYNLSLNYPSEGGKTIKVAFSGFIPDRESLFNFMKKLEKEEGIKEPKFPTSNWTKSTDISFSVTFDILEK